MANLTDRAFSPGFLVVGIVEESGSHALSHSNRSYAKAAHRSKQDSKRAHNQLRAVLRLLPSMHGLMALGNDSRQKSCSRSLPA